MKTTISKTKEKFFPIKVSMMYEFKTQRQAESFKEFVESKLGVLDCKAYQMEIIALREMFQEEIEDALTEIQIKEYRKSLEEM